MLSGALEWSLSLIGKLAHVAKIVKPDRIFLRRMLDVAHSVKDLNCYVKLKSEIRSSLVGMLSGALEWS